MIFHVNGCKFRYIKVAKHASDCLEFFSRGSKTASAKGATAGATEASAAARQDDVQ